MKFRDELDDLSPYLRKLVETRIETVRLSGRYSEAQTNDTEIYAYPHPTGGVAWGVNGPPDGFCIARGIEK